MTSGEQITEQVFRDIDPDFNFLSASECDYFDCDKLKMYNRTNSNDSHMSLFHVNVRSVSKNIQNLLNYLHETDSQFTILALTETWLTESNSSLYGIPGYRHNSLTRCNRLGGGVSLYLRESLVSRERTDFSTCNDHYESLFIEIIQPNSSNTIVGAIYRPPAADINKFLDYMEGTLQRIQSEHKEVYIMGDFNLDFLSRESRPLVQSFLDLMHASSLFPVIDKPTRVTNESATLIDNIFHNRLNALIKSGIILADISDHYPVFMYTTHLAKQCHEQLIKYRPFSETNRNAFKETISNINWDSIYDQIDAQEAYTEFYTILSDAYELHFPIKLKKPTKSDQNPWLTTGIKKSIKYKNNLYVRYRNRPNTYNKLMYNKYKNILNKVIISAKKMHYQELINENKNNPKKTWEILNEVTGRDKSKKSTPLKMATIEGRLTVDSNEISNGINKYFANVGSELESKIPPSIIDPCSYLSGNYVESLYLTPVTPNEIFSCLTKLKNSAGGWDRLKPEIIKSISEYISAPLTHIFNLCFEQSTFPNELKKANITPIHKSGDPSILSNFRPISVLPVFSKVLERLLHTRLVKYFDDKNILSDNQFGFRKKYSTEIALIYALEKITMELDQKNNVIGIFLDLKKAFDTVSHHILLRKLNHYGVRGSANDLIRNYLSYRTQSVVLNDNVSESESVTFGVPQGSILGPLLFNIYLNDFKNALSSGFPIMYADDTNIFISGNNIDTITAQCNTELGNINKYIQSNRLSLNTSKTQAMTFSNNPATRKSEPNIEIGGQKIEIVNSVSFLGVKIDNALSWTTHITHITSKISKSIGIIRKTAKLLNRNTLKSLYMSLVVPYLNYCNLIWGNASVCHLTRIHLLQKKAIRIIYGRQMYDHTAPYFADGKFLTIFDIYKLNCAIFIYKLINYSFPLSFNDEFKDKIFIFTHNVNVSHPTRSSNNNLLRLPRCRTSLRQKSLTYVLPKLYNEFLIPYGLIEASSLKNLKQNITAILIATYE